MRTLDKLRESLDRKLAEIRSLHRVIMSGEFGEFFIQSNTVTQECLGRAISECDRDRIVELLKHHRDMSEFSVKQLRLMCRMRNIKNYHLMTKAELLSCLTKNP